MKHAATSNPLVQLGNFLNDEIIGQEEAVGTIVETLSIAMSGLGDPEKPKASFLFTGPTGVGKTELAKLLASHLGMEFERFDMSEYADEYSARNLTGGQKGLVGYEEGGLLTNAIRKHPKCILLLDEIEKAHPKVYNTFLQVLDYGVLTDTKGKKAMFNETIIIMTSNLGHHEVETERSVGFCQKDNVATKNTQAVANFLLPEFRNRIDTIVPFLHLNATHFKKIAQKFIAEITNRLKSKKIALVVEEDVLDILANRGFDAAMGARAISRAINASITKNISTIILNENLSMGSKITVSLGEDQNLNFKYNRPIVPIEIMDKEGLHFTNYEEALEFVRENTDYVLVRAKGNNCYVVKPGEHKENMTRKMYQSNFVLSGEGLV